MRSHRVPTIMFLAACWLGLLLPGVVRAQFNYTTNDGAITITKYTGPGGEVVIPGTIDGMPVTSVGKEAFTGCTALTSVTMPGSVRNIGNFAFRNCGSLAHASIPSAIASLGLCAFMDCGALTSVTLIASTVSNSDWVSFGGCFDNCSNLTTATIAGGVTSIGDWAFTTFGSLTGFIVDAANPSYSSADGVLFDKGRTTLIRCPAGKAGSYAVPEGVTKIGHNAFNGCGRLTSVTIPDSVASIGGSVFSGCGGLTGVYFKGNAPRLNGDSLGSGMEATIHYDPGTQGWAAEFGGCPTATWNPDTVRRTVPLPSKRLLDRVAAGQEGGSHPLFESATAAAKNPFSYTTNNGAVTITKYTGPGGEVVIPGAIDGLPVTGIGGSAFANCDSLTSVLIPGGVASIGSYAFLACPKLMSVTISGSVTNVGDNLFKDCGSLVAINVDAANPSYSSADGVLFDKGQTTLIQCPGGKAGIYMIPSGVTDIGRWAFFGCARLTAIAVDAGNGSYSSVDGVLFDRGRSTLVRCPASKVGSYTIPSGFAGIGHGAFNHCSGLTNVTIPTGVTSIGDWAFGGCSSLASVTIPGGVTNIGQSAFWGCEGLTSVAIPAGVNSIGQFAFGVCGRLTEVTIPGSVSSIVNVPFLLCGSLISITVDEANPSYSSADGVLFDKDRTTLIQCPGGKAGSYAVPEGVTKIGHNAFNGCGRLTSVTIPDSVASIGGSVFSGCGGLTGVYFKGNAPRLGSDRSFMESGMKATIHYDPGTQGWAAEFGGRPTAVSGNRPTTVPAGAATLARSGGPFRVLPRRRHVAVRGANNGEAAATQGVAIAPGLPFTYTTNNGAITITKYTGPGGDVAIPSTMNGLPVTAVGDSAFCDCTALTSVSIPDTVTSLGWAAFQGCRNLVSVTIPNSVTNIGGRAFLSCTRVTHITIPKGITSIAFQAFWGCSGLTNVTIPDQSHPIAEGEKRAGRRP